MEQFNYRVEFEPFSERHYRKKFQKAYRNRWDSTERAIIALCARIDNTFLYNRASVIAVSGVYKLAKLDFNVAGTRESPKSSGNRCIICVDEGMRLARILLVYSKNEISPPNETQKWKRIIRDEYKDIGRIFGL
jgi:hypothetical protein